MSDLNPTDAEALANDALARMAVHIDPVVPGGETYTGTVDGKRFNYMLANRQTAERERDAALRRAAAWQGLLNSGRIRG